MPRPAKGARLYFREADQRWYIRDGSLLRSTGASRAGRAEAEQSLAAYLGAKHTPRFGVGDPDQVTVEDTLIHYVENKAPQTRRPDIVKGAVPHLGKFWAGRMIGDINPTLCGEYVKWRTAMPQARFKDPVAAPRVGDQTARRELEVLSAAIGYAYQDRKLKYVVPVALPTKSEPRERYLSRTEVARILWACRGRLWIASDLRTRRPIWAALRTKATQIGAARDSFYTEPAPHVARFVLLGVYTGTRHDALLKLRWVPSVDGGHLDLDKSILYRKGVREGQSMKRRTPVAISRRLAAHAGRWKASSDSSYVVSYQGDGVGKMNRAWKSIMRNAGVTDCSPHVLRHTFASWAVQEGESFDDVALALGTTPQIVRRVYGHLAPDHTRGTVEAVSGGVSGGRRLARRLYRD